MTVSADLQLLDGDHSPLSVAACGEVDGDLIAVALPDGTANCGLDGKFVGSVAQSHEGPIESFSVDGPCHLNETTRAEAGGGDWQLDAGPGVALANPAQRCGEGDSERFNRVSSWGSPRPGAARPACSNSWTLRAGADFHRQVHADEHTVVICDGRAFMGDYSESRSKIQAQPQPDSPVVRVRGRAVTGRVNVKRRTPSWLRPRVAPSGTSRRALLVFPHVSTLVLRGTLDRPSMRHSEPNEAGQEG